MPVKFPKRRNDGSFSVEVILSIQANDPKEFLSRVQQWLEQWVQSNRHWKTALAASAGGVLDFFDEFTGPPSCVLKGTNALSLRVQCRPNARTWWKDWLVLRILKDLQEKFIEVTGVDRIADFPDDL